MSKKPDRCSRCGAVLKVIPMGFLRVGWCERCDPHEEV